MPRGIESVAVEAFENETLYRHAEITFHRELSRQLVRRAGIMIRDPKNAEAVIRGRILEIPRIVLVEDRDDRILEGGLIVRIEIRLEDSQSGEPIIAPFVVVRRAEHIVPRGESLQFAIDEALEDAAKDAVDRLQAETFLRERVGFGG